MNLEGYIGIAGCQIGRPRKVMSTISVSEESGGEGELGAPL